MQWCFQLLRNPSCGARRHRKLRYAPAIFLRKTPFARFVAVPLQNGSHSLRLFACKRAHNAYRSLPTRFGVAPVGTVPRLFRPLRQRLLPVSATGGGRKRSPRRCPALGFKSFFSKIMSRTKPQKGGSDCEPPRGRLQPSRRAERGFLRKKEEQGSGRMTLFETAGKKSVGAKRTLLRRGGEGGI